MRIVIDVNHPAHVHMFRNAYAMLRKKGAQLEVWASEKDGTFELLDAFGIPFVNMGNYGQSRPAKLVSLPLQSLRATRQAWKFRPRLILGVASARAAHAAAMTPGCACWIFDDTEHASEQIMLYQPFVQRIYTPQCFWKDLGWRHRRYQGYHELSYLHPNRFTPDSEVLAQMGLSVEKPYFVVRFVSWKSTHDIGCHGFSREGKQQLIKTLEQYGRVMITSEAALPEEWETYRIPVKSHQIHHLLGFARLYIGEGATMASEAAMLGIPSIYVNTLSAATLSEQASYGLVEQLPDESRAISRAEELARQDSREEFARKRQVMLDDKIDVTAWLVDLIQKEFRNEWKNTAQSLCDEHNGSDNSV